MGVLESVRQAIYRDVIDGRAAPTPDRLGEVCGISSDAAREALRALADAHIIVLNPGNLELWAPPFSTVPTRFRVHARGASWFAPCAWDAFGIPAALEADASIETTCGASGAPIECGVRDGRAFGTGVIHLLVPAAHFWDDIIYT
jgi:hypothetical protein